MRERRCHYTRPMRLVFVILLVMVILAFIPGVGDGVHAASVKCKSRYYVTTTYSKNTLKKGQTAKVTVKVTNTSGSTMKTLKLKVKLPGELKKTKGALSKSKASLAKKKSYSFSFYVKAKKNLRFYKTVTTSRKVSKNQTKVVAKNRLKRGKTTKYTTVTFTFVKPAVAKTTKTTKTTRTATPAPASSQPQGSSVVPVYPSSLTDPEDYAQSMVALLTAMNNYAKAKNGRFAMISNGGYLLYAPGTPTLNGMLAAIDGALIEDAFTNEDAVQMQLALGQAAAAGKKAFSIEYNPFTGDGNVVSYDAEGIDELDQIPPYQKQGTAYDVNTLADVKDFMAILDPSKNYSKADLLQKLKDTDYDLIFLDLYYDAEGEPFTKEEVDSLKIKKNGGKRMVCSYLSVGEAEDYRSYWQPSWSLTRPAWIAEKNPEWKGNFKVRYWHPEWQHLLYGPADGVQPEGYLDKILAAGFDGVYLDVIDAYEYFEEQRQ